jgi:hypothetical protein
MQEQITTLAVLRFAEGWRIVDQRHRWGRFQYRVDAEEAALRLASRIKGEGREVQVLVQQGDGELRPLKVA